MTQIDEELKMTLKKREEARKALMAKKKMQDPSGSNVGSFYIIGSILAVAAPAVIGVFVWRYFYHINH